MKKRIIPLLSLLFLIAVSLCGCGNSDNAKTGEGLTKSEWIGLLGNKFGYNAYENTEDFYSDVGYGDDHYNEIQACAEWEILPETDTFHPKEKATWKYAIETSVRSIGIDKLNCSNIDMEVTEDNLVDFFVSRIAVVDDELLDMEVSETDAALILEHAYTYAANLKLVEKLQYVYNEGVKEAEAGDITLKGDGTTAKINGGNSYKEGDIIYVKPSEESAAYAVRVNSAEGDMITYEQAWMEDIYQELQITGTYEATILNVEPAEGVTISGLPETGKKDLLLASYMEKAKCGAMSLENAGQDQAEILQTGTQKKDNKVKFNVDTKQSASLEVSISDITVTSDVDFGIFAGLKKADVTLSFKDEAKAEYKIDTEITSEQIPLGTVEVVLGPTPLTVRFSLVANLGFNGEVTLSYSSQVVANVNYQKGKGLSKSVNNNNAECDFHAKATVTVEPAIKADLCCLGRSLANVKLTSGVVAIATVDIDLLGKQPECIDVYLYVPLRWAINEDGCVMTDISDKLKASGVVWDSENSPVNMRFHWENGTLVDACTRGEEVETEKVDEEGEPYDEYKIFDFEEIVFGFIKVSSQTLYLNPGETMAIGFLTLPDGYQAAEFVYQPENSYVCSAANGYVTAVGPGSTTLFISTADGKYSIYVTVVVADEYNDTSGFQSL